MEKFDHLNIIHDAKRSSVHKVQDRETGEICAVKIGHRKRDFVDGECKIYRKLDHINIVKFIDAHSIDERQCLFMEYSPDGDLKEAIAFKLIDSAERIEDYIKQIAHALQYCHEKGITHRDIKPDNILVFGDKVKLCDFEFYFDVNNPSSQEDITCGTLEYISPEQISGSVKRWTAYKIDSWSLGVTIYELVTGKLPFSPDGNVESSDSQDRKIGDPTKSRMILKNILTLEIDYTIFQGSSYGSEKLLTLVKSLLNRNVTERWDMATVIQHLTRNSIISMGEIEDFYKHAK